MPEKAQKRALQPAQTMLGRIHQSNFASSHCQLTLPDRQSCKTIEFAPRRHEHTWPHGVHHAGARAAVALGARPSRTWSAATRPPRSRRPRPPPATCPRDRSHTPAAAVRRVHCCHCATDCAGATRLRGLGAAAVAGPLTLRRPLLRAAWGVRGGARGAQRPPWHVFSARSSLEAMRPCGAWQLACSALDAENGIIKKVCILEKFSRLFCSSALRACIHACMQGHVLRDRSGAKGKRGFMAATANHVFKKI